MRVNIFCWVVVVAALAGCASTKQPRATAAQAGPPASETHAGAAPQGGPSDLRPLEDPELATADQLYAMRIAQAPQDPRGYMARGMVRQKAGDPAGAMRLYRQCLAVDRGFGPAYSNLGALMMEDGHPETAVTLLLEGAARVPDHAPIFANLAGAMSQLDRHDEAVSAAETAVELDAKDGDLRRNLAAVLYRAKRKDDAEKVLKRAMAEFPDDSPDFLLRLSELYMSNGDETRALDALEKVNRARPSIAVAWLRRAALLGRQDNLNGTIKVLLDALQHHPENEEVRGFFMAAMALRLHQDMEEGLDRIQKNGADVDAYLQVARVHELGKDYKAALDVLTDGVAHNPNSGELWSHIGLVESSLSREREALAAYRKAIALDHNLHVALNNCAYLLVTAKDERLHNEEDALRFAQQALAYQPLNVSYLDTLAEVQFARGDVTEARRLIARALELQPGDERLQAQARRFDAAGGSAPGKVTSHNHSPMRDAPRVP